MLTNDDTDLIHEWRDEILTNREYEISVIYLEKQYHPINGAPIGEEEISRGLSANVTEISSMIPERTLAGGIKYIEGDVKFDVKIELIDDIADEITRVEYDGGKYEIMAIDKKGIGRRNRYEIIGRLIA